MDNKILTGIEPIDKVPMEKGELVLLFGRPEMGKTTLMLKTILNLIKTKKSTTLFSIEMGQWQVLLRMVELDSGEEFLFKDSNDLTPIQCEKIGKSLVKIVGRRPENRSIFDIMDSFNLSDDAVLKHIIFNTEFLEKEQDVVFIDYLQLMELYDYENLIDKNLSDNEKRRKEQELILKNLKSIAEKYNVLIVVVSQLSRIFLREDITLENLVKYQFDNLYDVCDKVIILDSNEKEKHINYKDFIKKSILTVYDKNGAINSKIYNYNQFDDVEWKGSI